MLNFIYYKTMSGDNALVNLDLIVEIEPISDDECILRTGHLTGGEMERATPYEIFANNSLEYFVHGMKYNGSGEVF